MSENTPPDYTIDGPPPLPPTGREKRRLEKERRHAEKWARQQRAAERKAQGLPPLNEEDVSLEVKSPVLWILLLCVPVLFAVLMSFVSDRPNIAEKAGEPRPQAKRVRVAESRGPGVGRLPPYEEGGAKVPAGHVEAVYVCDFAPWVGLDVSEDMKAALEETGRPYRVLPPGSMMTMDHAPARVNFDVDAKGIITRVWCG